MHKLTRRSRGVGVCYRASNAYCRTPFFVAQTNHIVHNSRRGRKEGRTIMRNNISPVRFGIIAILALLPALYTGVSPASAEYPERTITLVVPYPPGGVTDLGAR